MADYYPLIARAVAGLEKNTGDARRALYERARTALVAQLRSVNPPLSENDVTRERLALEESIRKVEAEAARKTRVDPANGAAPTRVRAPEFPRWDPPPSSALTDDEQPPRHAAEPQTRHAAEPQAASCSRARRTRPSRTAAQRVGERPTAGGAPVALAGARPPPRHPTACWAASATSIRCSTSRWRRSRRPICRRGRRPRAPKQDRRSLQDSGLKNFRDVVSENGEDNDPLPRVVKNGPRATMAPLPSSHDFDRIDARSYDPHGTAMSDYPAQPMLEQGADYDDARPLPAKARHQAAPPWSAPRAGRSATSSGSRSRS